MITNKQLDYIQILVSKRDVPEYVPETKCFSHNDFTINAVRNTQTENIRAFRLYKTRCFTLQAFRIIENVAEKLTIDEASIAIEYLKNIRSVASQWKLEELIIDCPRLKKLIQPIIDEWDTYSAFNHLALMMAEKAGYGNIVTF